ncbi:hypothetical protein [Haloechinothrix sp. LS1_15]|uniref:hypothetical protein n=1 Tax=Haloechinothrix sp. LS1_15 TaxID=2652248 RepID=UPI002945AA37|nr:hypothetical protein [Haloechinothrix sp. LS1_15]MDV6012477.1 hypothetical protein [Haloechinothrix sp. LS1_15]
MNVTVAVAVITSLSTLSGAALTSFAAVRQTSRRMQHELAITREDRADSQRERRRQQRRDSYEKFLSRADAAYRVLDERWRTSITHHGSSDEAGFIARRGMDEAVIRVQLEGPRSVADKAAAVVQAISAEFQTCENIASEHANSEQCAAELNPAARTSAVNARFHTTAEFLNTARQALGA